ncbi:hypothetical protein ACN27G_06130 [Plantactinospora sp. WMMB334]|uniref:hypothetical protein n=1 Tax=Plantactinospora sp. WMMB334 TaxID=3404119 RepID=UPI003B9244EB
MADTILELPALAPAEPAGPLTEADLAALADAEETIAGGLQTYIAVGMALGRIRDGMLYRDTHKSFEDYVRSRWRISRSYAYSLMLASGTVSAIADAGLPTPPNEAQARELARLAEADRVDVWRTVLERTGGLPTAAAIRDVVADRVSAERGEVWAAAKRLAGGAAPTAEQIRQARADRAAATTVSPPDRDRSSPSDSPAVATTGPAGPVPHTAHPDLTPPPAAAGPAPGERVWMSTGRRGLDAHRIPSAGATSTACRRSLAYGMTLLASKAREKYEARPCKTCWPPAAVEERTGTCGRCGTEAELPELVDVDGVRQCAPCRVRPPDDYVSVHVTCGTLLPGDYIADQTVDAPRWELLHHIDLMPDHRSRVRVWGTDPVEMIAPPEDADRPVEVFRAPGRTTASGGVAACARCRNLVPVVVTCNDRCPACVAPADHLQALRENPAGAADGMVPGPEQELPAARVRPGDLVWVGPAAGWEPATSVEILPEPDTPGGWTVVARTTSRLGGTYAWDWPWDEPILIRRPVPGTAEPADITPPAPAPAVDEPAAAPVPAAAGPAPVDEPPARPPRPPLTVEQIGRLRAAYAHARAHGWRHPAYGDLSHLARDYVPARAARGPDGDRVARVAVTWDAEGQQIEIWYRGGQENELLYDIALRVADVDQGLDVLCALGLLPVAQSSAYLAGLAAAAGGSAGV